MEFVIEHIEEFQYLAIAFVLFIAGLGVPIPEDIPLIYGGVMAGRGDMNVWIHFAVSIAFILIGDVCLYMIGKRLSRASAAGSGGGEGESVKPPSRLAKLLTPERRAQVQEYFDRYGSWTVFFGRFVAGIRGAVFLTAGLTHFPLRRFIILDGLAALVSVPVWIGLGYWFGANWREHLETFKSYQIYIIGGVVALVVIIWLWKRRGSTNSNN